MLFDFQKLINDLNQSMMEEQQAISAYRQRATTARNIISGALSGLPLGQQGQLTALTIGQLYDHIANEEQHHLQEEQAMLYKVQAAQTEDVRLKARLERDAKEEAARLKMAGTIERQKAAQGGKLIPQVGDMIRYKAGNGTYTGKILRHQGSVYLIHTDNMPDGWIHETFIIGKV